MPSSKEEPNSEPFYELVASVAATPRQQEVRKHAFPPENKDQLIAAAATTAAAATATAASKCEMVCKAMYYFQGFLNGYMLYHQVCV